MSLETDVEGGGDLPHTKSVRSYLSPRLRDLSDDSNRSP